MPLLPLFALLTAAPQTPSTPPAGMICPGVARPALDLIVKNEQRPGAQTVQLAGRL